MGKRNIIILTVVFLAALIAIFGSRPFQAFLNNEAGTTSPHAIDQ
ncbi:hypothetical protein [Rhizobium terrae]|nr:hypothetical protein [Rhizobium terrae]